jgi:acyl-CoA reductase-like NAD-dependent aldehyde dehydrogenase
VRDEDDVITDLVRLSLPLLKWSNDDEVLDRVNDTLQGLGGSVWSRDLERATRIAQAIQSG